MLTNFINESNLLNTKWRSSIQSAKTRPGADCGSDHELLIAKFIKLKKVGKTTRPFRYDLNQILMTIWTFGAKYHRQGKEMQKSKWLSEEALQIAMKRREVKSKGEK